MVALLGIPGRCNFVWHGCAGGIATPGGGTGAVEYVWATTEAKKCTFIQTEVAFLGHIVGQTGLACDPGKVSAVRAWHVPDSVMQVRQFVGFIGYYRRFIQNFAGFSEPLVSLARKGVAFVLTTEEQVAFDTSNACLLQAPILGFPTEEGWFILDTDASLFAVGASSTSSKRPSL